MNLAKPQPEPILGDVPQYRSSPQKPPTLLTWLALVLSHRRVLLSFGLLGALAGLGLALIEPRQYTAAALSIMDTQTSSSAISGLTASLGLTPLQGDGSPSPAFYADLVTSDLVLRGTVDSSYRYQSGNRIVSGNLVALFQSPGKTPDLRRHNAMARLKKMVSARVTPKTGVITVSATTHDPQLAPLIVARLISEVNRVNVLSRQNQAGGEREFTGRRVIEAAQELRAAEDRLQDFLQTNRAYNSAPQTALEQDRLARSVAMRQTIYTTVAQAYEQAKIQEARDTPGLRIVEPATVPVVPNPRGLTRAVVLGLFLGLIVALCISLWIEYLNEVAEQDPEQAGRFKKVVRESLRDISHPWLLFRERRPG